MESFYDKEVDTLGITIDNKENFNRSVEICTGVYIDLNNENEPIGVEIHNVKRFMKNKIYEIEMGLIYETSSNKTERDVFNDLQKLLDEFNEKTGRKINIFNINLLDV